MEIKSCPFCGKKDFSIMHDEKFGQIIRCRNCGCMVASHLGKDVALERWNTRPANNEPLTDVIEKLVEELENCYGHETELTETARDILNRHKPEGGTT